MRTRRAALRIVCGLTPLVEAVQRTLVDFGHSPDRMKTEKLGPIAPGLMDEARSGTCSNAQLAAGHLERASRSDRVSPHDPLAGGQLSSNFRPQSNRQTA